MEINLKNDKERKEFLRQYHLWENFANVPELNVSYYRVKLKTNALIIATELKFVTGFKQVNFSMIIGNDHLGKTYYDVPSSKHYNLNGCSVSSIVEYLKINKTMI